MSFELTKVEDVCTVKVGYPMSRIKAARKSMKGSAAKVLMPSAMADDYIIDNNLAYEEIVGVKDDFFTRKTDIVLKLSAPFNCVLIDATHEGLLVTSFAVILRPKANTEIDMRYLTAFFNSRWGKQAFQESSTGSVLPMLKKGLIEQVAVPLIPLRDQQYLGALYKNTQKRKSDYRRLIELSDVLMESEMSDRAFTPEADMKG